MNCQNISQLTAWNCQTVKGARGEDITMLAPPVSFWDGTIVPVYIIDRSPHIEITDDGGVLEHLDISGFKLGDDKRRRKGLQKAVSKWNASFESELQVWCKPEDLGYGLQRYLAALFSVAHWEAENAGKAVDTSILTAEAEMYLTALNPQAEVRHNIALTGLSGRVQRFPLALNQTLYDAVGSHPASSAAMVKKLFDVRNIRENKDVQITVVVDDRDTEHEKQSKADIQLFSQLAHVNRFSQLEKDAMTVLTTQ